MKVRSVLSVLAGFTMLFALHAGAQGTLVHPLPAPLRTSSPHRLTPEQIAKMPVKALPIRDFKLLSPGAGWASTGDRLLFTTDSGAHWKDISPPNPNSDEYASVFFLNSDCGWVLFSQILDDDENESEKLTGDRRFYVSATINGGTTWTTEILPAWHGGRGLSNLGVIAFADKHHGWLSMGIEGNTMTAGSALLATSDGGRSWVPTKGGAEGRVRAMLALSDKDVWVLGSPEGETELDVSHDGGSSFQEVDLPAPKEIAPVEDPTYGLPVFEDKLHGFETVTYSNLKEPASNSTLVLFETRDGGRTWKTDRMLLDLASREPTKSTVVGSDWILPFAPKGSRPTLTKPSSNGRTIAKSHIAGDFYRCDLSFLTPDEGWANCSGELSSTNDGGASWAAITPRVRNGVLSTDPITALPTPKSMKAPQVKLANPKDVPNTSNGPSGGSQSGVDQRLGFDATDVPVPGDMGVWWDHSPYYDVGIYLPGSPNRSSKHAYASKIWVDDVLVQGWGVWPVWFGFQAPCACHPIKTNQSTTYPSCNPFTDHFDFKPSEAEKRGKEQAAAATAAANALGLDGSIIYTDLEQYTSSDTDVANPSLTCGAAVQA